jgi:hypothetical protein
MLPEVSMKPPIKKDDGTASIQENPRLAIIRTLLPGHLYQECKSLEQRTHPQSRLKTISDARLWPDQKKS